jgi:PmbA protein
MLLSMQRVLSTEEITSYAFDYSKKLGCDDVSILGYQIDESQVRFSNNSITLVNNVREITLQVYLTKERRRILGSTFNPTEQGINKFIDNIFTSCRSLPRSEDYVALPKVDTRHDGRANFDERVKDADLVGFVKQAIDSSLGSGAKRVSGSLNTSSLEAFIQTSGGATGKYFSSEMLLNVRAFAEDNASGHGLCCTSYVSDFDPENAGRIAGDYAKRSKDPRTVSEGKYDVIFTPTVIANILPVASSASAFAIESGLSFLPSETEKEIAVKELNVDDYGVYEGGLGGRLFDDEGLPTQHTPIVIQGIFKNMLHNSTTAKKFKSRSTGNAGIISPFPSTVVFGERDSSIDEMIRETKNGILITNNWYTRYQNMRSGEYSTVPRDAAFRIENGEIREPVSGIRISDSIPRQLSNISLISRERQWIKWWEVSTPTLAPAMLIKDVQITKAVGS